MGRKMGTCKILMMIVAAAVSSGAKAAWKWWRKPKPKDETDVVD